MRNARLINRNLNVYCERYCAFIEKVQMLERAVCELYELNYPEGKTKAIRTRIDELGKIFEMSNSEFLKINQIISLRNNLVHEFFINPSIIHETKFECITLPPCIAETFNIITELVFELIDYIANFHDNACRPNYIAGSYDINELY